MNENVLCVYILMLHQWNTTITVTGDGFHTWRCWHMVCLLE